VTEDQIKPHYGVWSRVSYVSEDGEAVTNSKAMPRGYSHDGLHRFTTGGPTGGWELFLLPSDVISIVPIKED
jgi:hypothetical protein